MEINFKLSLIIITWVTCQKSNINSNDYTNPNEKYKKQADAPRGKGTIEGLKFLVYFSSTTIVKVDCSIER